MILPFFRRFNCPDHEEAHPALHSFVSFFAQ